MIVDLLGRLGHMQYNARFSCMPQAARSLARQDANLVVSHRVPERVVHEPKIDVSSSPGMRFPTPSQCLVWSDVGAQSLSLVARSACESKD